MWGWLWAVAMDATGSPETCMVLTEPQPCCTWPDIPLQPSKAPALLTPTLVLAELPRAVHIGASLGVAHSKAPPQARGLLR